MYTKRLCRAAVIAALYTAITLIFTPFAFGPIQVRPAEAFCILPLFFPESIVGLTVGCALSNLASPFVLYDLPFGSLATLLAAVCTFLVGKRIQNTAVKIAVGGIFPVLFNAIIVPFVIVVLCGDNGGYATALIAYGWYALSIGLTQAVWVYGLGTPLYFSISKLQKNVSFLR